MGIMRVVYGSSGRGISAQVYASSEMVSMVVHQKLYVTDYERFTERR